MQASELMQRHLPTLQVMQVLQALPARAALPGLKDQVTKEPATARAR